MIRGYEVVYDPKAPVISLHIPKTGGTSLHTVLEEWFPADRLLLHYRVVPPGSPPRHKFEGPICIHGHFNSLRGFGVSEYYPQATQFFTFLREPFDRFCSLWFYMHDCKRRGLPPPDLEDEPSFETWMHRCAARHSQGLQDNGILCQLPHSPKASLDQFVFDETFIFVGIMERYVESLAALGVILGKPLASLPHLNAVTRFDDLGRWRPLYERHFEQEYAVYEAALAINAELLAAVR